MSMGGFDGSIGEFFFFICGIYSHNRTSLDNLPLISIVHFCSLGNHMRLVRRGRCEVGGTCQQ